MKKLALHIIVSILFIIGINLLLNLNYYIGATATAEDTQELLVISEIAAFEPSSLEWVEVTNIGTTTINIEEFIFFEDGINHGLSLITGTPDVQANESVIIANNAEDLLQAYNLENVTIFDSSWGSLKESGEEIGLKNSDNKFLELFTYIAAPDSSLQRINLEIKDYSSSNWMEAPITPSLPNFTIEINENKTIIEIPSTDEVDVIKKANESEVKKPVAVISVQSGVTKGYGSVKINLDGSNSYDPQKQDLSYYWDLGEGSTYDNKNPRVKTYKEIGTYLVTLRVSNESGLFSEQTIEITVLPEVIVEEPELQDEKKADEKALQTIKNLTDENEEIELPATPDVVQKNYPTILISEVFPNPSGKDSGLEWVELFNPNQTAVNLQGYMLDDYLDKGSKAQKLEAIEIAPLTYYLIYNPKISLNNSDEELNILDPNGYIKDTIYYENSIEEMSYAKGDSGFEWTSYITPNYANQIVATTETEEEATQESEYQNGDLSAYIYISELLPNPKGSDTDNEWIELQNISNQHVNLGNWVLDDNTEGSKPFTIPDTYSIEPYGYLVIERPESKIGLDNRSDTVRLFNYENELQDSVTYEKAKEGMSFANITIKSEESTEARFEYTNEITKGAANKSLYKVRGKVEEKNEEIVFVKAKALTLKEDNELNDMILTPGNLVELTYDDSNTIKDFSLIKEKTITQPTNNNHVSTLVAEVIKTLLLATIAFTYFIKQRKKHVTL